MPVSRLTPSAPRRIPVILVVEDEVEQRRIYAELLGHEGMEVLEAGDAESGIAMARQWMPDLVLMDVNLPGPSGWNAAHTLKEDPATHRIAIIAVTGLVGLADRDASYASGCDEYLQKPINPKLLIATIRQILHERGVLP